VKLYETITAENWHKGDLTNEDGSKRCLMGHLQDGHYNSTRDVSNAIAALYPERGGLRGGNIASFNDHLDTTLEDIIRVCKVANA
jgi:hypothetical protein